MIGVIVGGGEGIASMMNYLFIFMFMNMGAFAVVIMLTTEGFRGDQITDYEGLAKSHPLAAALMLIFMFSLTGIPPLAGFWSKDEIISTAFRTGHYWVWGIALITAILTAFYMTRAVLLTFYGDYRGHGHAHEMPRVMTGPLVVLAGLSVVTGFLGAPQFGAIFAEWVHFGEAAHHEPFSYGFAAVSILGAVAGIVVTAAVVGWFSIKWLIDYLSRRSLYVFAAYCAVVGTIVFFLR